MKTFLIILFLIFLFIHLFIQNNWDNSLGKKLAEGNCISCHPASKELKISSLKGIRKLRTEIWLYKFINNPSKMIASDKEAQKLFQEWKPVVMTGFPNLKKREIDAILDYYDSLPTTK